MERTYSNIRKEIVTVSRLDIQQKRQDIIIKGFKLFFNSHPDYTLHIFGDGPDCQLLKKMASNNSSIVFEGETSDIIESIQNAAIFV